MLDGISMLGYAYSTIEQLFEIMPCQRLNEKNQTSKSMNKHARCKMYRFKFNHISFYLSQK